jgi:hypothetical protein
VRRALADVQRRRAERLAEAMLAATGLGSGQVEWFVAGLVEALTRGVARSPLSDPGRS